MQRILETGVSCRECKQLMREYCAGMFVTKTQTQSEAKAAGSLHACVPAYALSLLRLLSSDAVLNYAVLNTRTDQFYLSSTKKI